MLSNRINVVVRFGTVFQNAVTYNDQLQTVSVILAAAKTKDTPLQSVSIRLFHD